MTTKATRGEKLNGRSGKRSDRRQTIVGDMGRPQNKPDMSTYSKRVGNRVRVLRVEKDWSSDDLWLKLRAAGVDVTSGTVRSWESGRRPVNPDYYPAIAKVFGLKLFEFLPDR